MGVRSGWGGVNWVRFSEMVGGGTHWYAGIGLVLHKWGCGRGGVGEIGFVSLKWWAAGHIGMVELGSFRLFRLRQARCGVNWVRFAYFGVRSFPPFRGG